MISKRNLIVSSLLLFISNSFTYDLLLEVKGGAFVSTNECFKQMYARTTGSLGTEITFNAWDHHENYKILFSGLYGFVSAHYLSKNSKFSGLCTPIKTKVTAIGIGIKYLFPYYWGDVYAGIGALPTHIKIERHSADILQKTAYWSCGGIAKFGAYVDLPCSFLLDIFIDYQFINIHHVCYSNEPQANPKLNGVITGIGLGYRFN